MSYKIPQQIFGNKTGPVIFFLHGFMGEVSDFNYFYQKLGGAYQLVGLSYPHVPTNFHEYCQNLSDLIKSFKGPRYFVGYSMGGRIALALSHRYPELLKKQIIISAHPGLEDQNEKKLRFESDQKILGHVTDEASWQNFLKEWYSQEIFGEIKSHQDFPLLINKSHSNLDYYKQCLLNFSLGKQKSYWIQQQTPTHFVVGAQDKKYLQIGQHFLNQNPTVKLSIINEAGHKCYFERPEDLLQIITSTF